MVATMSWASRMAAFTLPRPRPAIVRASGTADGLGDGVGATEAELAATGGGPDDEELEAVRGRVDGHQGVGVVEQPQQLRMGGAEGVVGLVEHQPTEADLRLPVDGRGDVVRGPAGGPEDGRVVGGHEEHVGELAVERVPLLERGVALDQ